MIRLIVLLCILCFTTGAQASCVILLHGLLRSPASMLEMELALQKAGYKTVNLGYPSREFSIEELAPMAIDPALKQCPEGEGINFVTHSLGGILVRQYLSQYDIPNLKRVVMMGPPNQGSEIVDELGDVYGFEWMNGPAGLQLGTAHTSIPNALGPVHFDLGVISGNRTINWVMSYIIPGSDDGKVSIERTKVDGMNEHIILPVNHATMMDDQRVIEAVKHYVELGRWG